uniref:AlNc14C23G2309 protein n=1 Tax=Albugo laibachii Nc14 TaxID=890382 RepID=F0W604_9STRA|nr:AlNc14C23G2309 [Albugo laibachii Nc14]|eukprot:CCA16546.1 AlNc14C23G2309 [Albugo laibachii Nc14]
MTCEKHSNERRSFLSKFQAKMNKNQQSTDGKRDFSLGVLTFRTHCICVSLGCCILQYGVSTSQCVKHLRSVSRVENNMRSEKYVTDENPMSIAISMLQLCVAFGNSYACDEGKSPN